MAKFKKGESGNPAGRPFGAKDKIPRGTFRAICAAYVEQNADKVQAALERAITGRFPDKGLSLLLKAEGETVHLPELEDLASVLARKVIFDVQPGPTKGA